MTAAAAIRALLHTSAFACPARLWPRTARAGWHESKNAYASSRTRRESSCTLDLDLKVKVKA